MQAHDYQTPQGPSDSAWGLLLGGMSAVGSILICLIMGLICLEVVLRSAFNISIPAVADVVAVSIVAIVFLQLSAALRSNRMVQAEIFIEKFVPRYPRAGQLLLVVLDLAGALMFGIIAWASKKPLVESWVGNDFFGVVGIFTAPTWPALLIVVIGSVMTCIQYLLKALSNFNKSIAGVQSS